MHAIVRNKILVVTYILTILYALHYAIPVYATSSYLHKYFNTSFIGGLYVVASIMALFASMSVAKSIKRFHTYHFTFSLVILEILFTVLFAISKNPFLLGLFFIIHHVLQILLYVCLNIFVESFGSHANTGSIRGLFLAILNMGYLISPLIGGLILSNTPPAYSFSILYIVSALLLIPFLYLTYIYLQHVKEPAYHSVNIVQAIRTVSRNKNLRAVFLAELMVNSFYATMVIYSPIYLATIGIPLTSYLTFILPLALLPLVLLPFELGFLADTKLGEKNILITGLLILVITTFLCVMVTSSDLRLWALILIISRVGASCVQTMTFTYFFKKIGSEDASLTALFSNAYGMATIMVGSIGFVVGPLLAERPQLMFIILGCAIVWSISHILPLKDIAPQQK